ncbi:NADP-dependent oxidoreductase [Flavitalea sp. BT771]|uniref:NADP-dependent oxidoreductase n=1 Tax=Flavitalea sp. BT771 TaxID=3063329 RepID=UPI0026E147FB|nr:NADP-dependent oxidoreductase [Flavitalea sp. BT771]MDO6432838.1 NADP-dependent oxidoreductase [Flavitalea sp. BT771]MDV6221886.1 NADP-dependent oxidoreductase [Flavitalea sp. BT771]
MKAMVLKSPGGVENLILEDIPVPTIKDDEVLVKIKAISVNPVDATLRRNGDFLRLVLHLKKDENPVLLGWDISGVVEQTGSAVTRLRKGDEVFGMVNFTGHGKAYAEYVAAREDHVALKPSSVTHAEAAAATLAALTAWQTLVHLSGVKAGDKVLVHSAAGGVGHYAVQIARHLGAYVIGTSSAVNKDFVLGLGADEHIDYSKQRFEEWVNDADVVVDSVVEKDHLERSLQALKRKGKLISLVVFPDERLSRLALMSRKFLYRMEVGSDGADMQAIAELLGKGHLRSHISRTFSFHEIPLAHKELETGHTRGKIVIMM